MNWLSRLLQPNIRRLQAKRGVSSLVGALTYPDPDIQRSAEEALIAIRMEGRTDVIDELFRVSLERSDLRPAAIRILRNDPHGHAADKAVDLLFWAMEGLHGEGAPALTAAERQKCVKGAEWMREILSGLGAAAVPHLLRGWWLPDAGESAVVAATSKACAEQLLALGSSAIPLIDAAAGSEDVHLREAARRFLAKYRTNLEVSEQLAKILRAWPRR